MYLDLVFVTYNSEKWINNCFKSIFDSNSDTYTFSFYIVDNNSSDKTIKYLENIKEKYQGKYKEFRIVQSSKNLGFGKGNNLGFKEGNAPYVFFLNIDTEVNINTFSAIEKEVNSSSQDVGLWELRQFPYEHPKFYDPVSLETSWASGAAFVIKRKVFEEVGGFDDNIFMYAEDVDLSWRVKLSGYKLKYIPNAVVNHYCYQEVNEVKPVQYYNSIINNILLRYKFGGAKEIVKGYIQFFKLFFYPQPFKHARLIMLKCFFLHYLKVYSFLNFYIKNKGKIKKIKPHHFGNWDYERVRIGAFYENFFPSGDKKVSVIVRTCSRPEVLRETLISLRNQTYRNFEVILVEDGENTSEGMVKNDFSDIDIKYFYTGEKAGRCRVGNIGLEKASGDYINFLDDDDLFFADHLEVLVGQLEKNSDYRVAYSIAYDTGIKVESLSPYKYEVLEYHISNNQPFNRYFLCFNNYIPIQTIMFERDIYLEEGGIDEQFEVLEDWDLWLRYSLRNEFLYVPKITSIYRVPSDEAIKLKRQKVFDEYLPIVREKHKNYKFEISARKAADEVEALMKLYKELGYSESLANFKKNKSFLYHVLGRTYGLAKNSYKYLTKT